MPLREVIDQHPAWLGLMLLAWIGVGVWIVSVILWAISGEIDTWFAVIAAAVGITLGYFTLNPPIEAMRPIMPLAIILTAVGYPIVRRAMTEHELAEVEEDALRSAYTMLRENPRNFAMRFRVAERLYERGQVAPAIAIGSEAVKGMPENVFADEIATYARWQHRHPGIDLSGNVACVNCGQSNPVSSALCERCGSGCLVRVGPADEDRKGAPRKLVAGWLIAIFVAVGIPSSLALPASLATPVILALVAGAAGLVLWAMRE